MTTSCFCFRSAAAAMRWTIESVADLRATSDGLRLSAMSSTDPATFSRDIHSACGTGNKCELPRQGNFRVGSGSDIAGISEIIRWTEPQERSWLFAGGLLPELATWSTIPEERESALTFQRCCFADATCHIEHKLCVRFVERLEKLIDHPFPQPKQISHCHGVFKAWAAKPSRLRPPAQDHTAVEKPHRYRNVS